jgi:hypothetical protein
MLYQGDVSGSDCSGGRHPASEIAHRQMRRLGYSFSGMTDIRQGIARFIPWSIQQVFYAFSKGDFSPRVPAKISLHRSGFWPPGDGK